MTQQTLVLEPPTLRYAVTPHDGASIRPDAANEGLLRPGPGGSDHWSPERRRRRTEKYIATMTRRRDEGGKFHPSRYVGLMNNSGRRDKYKDAERVGTVRKLMPHEIDEWYTRLAAMQRGERIKTVGPLEEKSR